MDAADIVKRATDVAHVGRAFGTGYERNDCLVIPVCWIISVGGGGGGTEGSSSLESVEGPGGGGGGGGFVSISWPLGAYVVKDGTARWVPAVDVTRLAIAGLALLRHIPKRRSRRRRMR
jgi:uncharacterized spore protein YtfJ